ncbi:MAG: 30S ribosome-binding factor RbfA [Planctomycetota bacterium]
MPNPRRIERLEQVILRTLGPEISQLADPRLGMITITRIRLSRDLALARVNWSCVGTQAERELSAHALEHARGYLQSAIADAMRTRVTPRLEFYFDPSMENAARIGEILHQLAEERGDLEEETEEEPAEGTEKGPAEAPDDEPASE